MTRVKKGIGWTAIAGALLAGAWTSGVARLSAQDVTFRGGVDMVVLNVAVADKDGKQVLGLERQDFSVFEGNRKQDVDFFQKSDVPLAVTMLLDVSDSMGSSLAHAQKAAIGFVELLGPGDSACIVSFDKRMRDPLPFTSDHAALERAIRSTVASGTTALYDTVYIALKELGTMGVKAHGSPMPQRQAIVLLTDGIDSTSLMTFDDMMDAVRRSDAAIYVVRMPTASNANLGPDAPDFVLGRLAQQTGGRVYTTEAPSQLPAVFRQIKTELAGQYMLAYHPNQPRRDGRFHQVAVRMERPGLIARTRPGYVAGNTN